MRICDFSKFLNFHQNNHIGGFPMRGIDWGEGHPPHNYGAASMEYAKAGYLSNKLIDLPGLISRYEAIP